jgi:type II secretory pathway pseudopilin PulG
MRKKNKSFTLIEMITSIAIFALVFVTAGGAFYSMLTGWMRQRNNLIVIQNARWALELLTREAQQAEDIKHPPKNATKDQLSFDIKESPPPRGVRFRLNATELPDPNTIYRQEWKGGPPTTEIPLIDCVVDLYTLTGAETIFEGGGSLENPDDFVFIELMVRPNPKSVIEGWMNRNMTFRSAVRSRNSNK